MTQFSKNRESCNIGEEETEKQSFCYLLGYSRGVDVNKRTVTTQSYT